MGRNLDLAIVALLREGPPGRMLDVPCGDGHIAREARALGYRVYGLDLFPSAGVRGVQADACAPLPFQDESFDVLVSMEGIEHFENQMRFLRECARVLKPDGRLILSTPNVMHLSSRVSGFLTGQRVMKQGLVNEYSTLRDVVHGRPYHGHAFLIDAIRLRYLLCIAGLKFGGLRACSLSLGSAALAPTLPVIWAANRWALSAGRGHLQRRKARVPPPDVEEELLSISVSPALLFSKTLVLHARKPANARVARV